MQPADLLIPAKKKLWSKTDATTPLSDTATTTQPRQTVRSPGKPGHIRKDKSFDLIFRETDHINSALSDQVDLASARKLTCNITPKRVFQGVTPGYGAFVLSPAERSSLIAKGSSTSGLIFPYLVGDELLSADGSPRRYVIDAQDHDLTSLQQHPGIFHHLQLNVLPTGPTATRRG